MSTENKEVEYIGENFAVLHGAGAVVSLAADIAKKPDYLITNPMPEGSIVQYWGGNNLLPSEQRQQLEKTTTAFPLIANAAKTLFGRGPQYYLEKRTSTGIVKDYTPVPEIEEFLQGIDLELIMLERWMDLKMYNNLFCEFITNGAGTKIVNITHQEAEFCRFGLIKDNKISQVLINSDWEKYPANYATVPFFDDYATSREEALKTAGAKKKFITHNNIPSPGRTLYAVPSHVGLFQTNGWIDYSLSVPLLMNKINQNGFALRYHIEIPYDFWEKTYQDWKQKTPAEQQTLKDAKMDEMNNFLKGIDNVGKNFYSHFGVHQATGKEIAGWKITELKDPIKKDQFLTSLQEADMQTARAIGVDVSLANISNQSNSMGAGSGSDKRVGMNNTISSSYAEQMIVLKPLKTVGIINQWPSNVKWTFEYEVPTTLNENKSGTKIIA